MWVGGVLSVDDWVKETMCCHFKVGSKPASVQVLRPQAIKVGKGKISVLTCLHPERLPLTCMLHNEQKTASAYLYLKSLLELEIHHVLGF